MVGQRWTPLDVAVLVPPLSLTVHKFPGDHSQNPAVSAYTDLEQKDNRVRRPLLVAGLVSAQIAGTGFTAHAADVPQVERVLMRL
jgi:hypothetical protein